jgi:hypothetical protein
LNKNGRRVVLGAVALMLGLAKAAFAAPDDGTYGRLDGDVELDASAGVAFAEGGPSLALSAAALYLTTAGLYASYVDAVGSNAVSRRSIATGIVLRPLFLGRYASDLERGPAHFDLLLDSIALEVGAFWGARRDEGIAAEPGLELSLGLDLPVLPSANGPFLAVRSVLRWHAADFGGDRDPSGVVQRGALVTLALAWHQVVLTHIVDAGDRLQ